MIDLHAEAHVPEHRQEGERQEDGDDRMMDARHKLGAAFAQMRDDEAEHEQDQRDVGNGGDTLQPPMLGAGLGRAQAADTRERRAHAHCITP